jgi:2-dehydro-3-deoxyphosphogluconate aldolase/(4S)-4-hydroxy-2-oxoglutarate aldolase
MSRHEDLERVHRSGIVAVIRSPSSDQIVDVATALYEGGIDVLEVTFTVPDVLVTISAVRKRLAGRVLLGAGTVLDAESARAALLAGAEFVVAPTVNVDVIKLCNRYDKLAMPGAFTPTEVLSAWQAGADLVKIFPAEVGGPAYLKALHGPLPQVRLLPTGGVNLQTIANFLHAGAYAVGLGAALVDPKAVASGNMARIQELAAQYVAAVKSARACGSKT